MEEKEKDEEEKKNILKIEEVMKMKIKTGNKSYNYYTDIISLSREIKNSDDEMNNEKDISFKKNSFNEDLKLLKINIDIQN